MCARKVADIERKIIMREKKKRARENQRGEKALSYHASLKQNIKTIADVVATSRPHHLNISYSFFYALEI